MKTLQSALIVLLFATSAAFAQFGPTTGGTQPPSGTAGGDLGGTYPNPNVTNGSHIVNSSIPNSGLATPAPCSAFGTTVGTCLQGNAATLAPSYYLSGNWYFPFGPINTNAGAATTANTIYCFYGWVSAPVTIKSLGAFLATGTLTNTLQLAVYSQSAGTLTLVDSTGNINAGTVQSASAINGAVSNTTDNLKAGVLYAFCENSPGAMVLTSTALGLPAGQPELVGSATQTNINVASSGSVTGRSIAQTYGTWPGTITESSMADTTTAVVAMVSFQVN